MGRIRGSVAKESREKVIIERKNYELIKNIFKNPVTLSYHLPGNLHRIRRE